MLSWYALHVRHQCELLVQTALQGYCETFWPHRSTKTSNKRTHRRAWFPGYMFVCADWTQSWNRNRILGTCHVLGILGAGSGPIPIPDVEIESLRTLMDKGAMVMQYPFAHLGDRVRVTRGPLTGVEGILVRFGGGGTGYHLVVQIELLGRAVAAQLHPETVEALARTPHRPKAA